MIFLQPLLLWGLGLAALPLIIHLLNRLRYRTVKWGAMMFLLRVSRSASRRSRLRHYLILACRTLALALLALAMARPLFSGWFASWGRSPDAVLLLLDRSASMERRDVSGRSLRESALARLGELPPEPLRGSRTVFFDSVFQTPREIASASAASTLDWAGPSDTAADWPSLMESALDWIERHQPGRAELWALSDAQASDWRADSPAWAELNRRLAGRRPAVRVRALIMGVGEAADNAAVLARGVQRHPDGGYELAYALAAAPREDPLQAALLREGARTLLPLAVPAAATEGALRIPDGERFGWAAIELPADGHPGDNSAWFAFGPSPEGVVWARTDDEAVRARIRNAFRPARSADPHPVRDWTASAPPPLGDAALVIWQGDAPAGPDAQAVDAFVRGGGAVLALPSLQPAPEAPADALWSWSAVEEAPPGGEWRIAEWPGQTGPLAQTIEGSPLPVGEAPVFRRAAFSAPGLAPFADARFGDGPPALLRLALGGGQVYALTTLPVPAWSGLGDGRIWVPALWRLRQQGASRLGDALQGVCGQWQPESPDPLWEAVEPAMPRDPRVQAGVYRLGGRLLALNRPEREDEADVLDAKALQALLPDVSVEVSLASGGSDGQPADGTLTFFLLAAFFFLAEAALALSLHPSPAARSAGKAVAT